MRDDAPNDVAVILIMESLADSVAVILFNNGNGKRYVWTNYTEVKMLDQPAFLLDRGVIS